VLVTTSGAKLLDFGLAKRTTQPVEDDATQTSAGIILGTASYMSPEQPMQDRLRQVSHHAARQRCGGRGTEGRVLPQREARPGSHQGKAVAPAEGKATLTPDSPGNVIYKVDGLSFLMRAPVGH
jgi:serine/threonine protein kinase